MANKKLVFISDIHIGNNSPTNWFQSTVHPPFLGKLLEYVRENTGTIGELIILGDLVDQWMYTPTEQPPSLAEIKAANPDIFGGEVNGKTVTGSLIETVDALDAAGGKTTYIAGNHDMFITPEEVSHTISPKIRTNNGYRVYTPDAGEGQIVCTHGHVFSLFNAQDYKSYPNNFKGLSLAHFISRLGARWTAQELSRKGLKNAAQLPDTGDPEGWLFDAEAILGLLESLLEDKDHISELIMNALSEATGKVDDSFIMMDGCKEMLDSVETLYKSLYNDYPDSTKTEDLLLPFGALSPLFALTDTDMGNKIDHFAKESSELYPLIIMGHTHVPVLHHDEFLFSQKAVYANSGFWCPSVPDMENKGKYPTFVEVEIENRLLTTSVKQVVKQGNDYVIQPHMGPMSIAMR